MRRDTRSHRDALDRDGYTVVSGLVPERLVKAAAEAICHFVHADLNRPHTWYRHEPLEWSVVPMHHPKALWDVRQWPPVHDAFASLLGTEKLWVTMDRGVFKVPHSAANPQHLDASILHWDIDPRVASSHTFQGMLFLTDAGPGEGCFECVPAIFGNLDAYLAAHPGPLLDVPVDIRGFEVVEVPARAGDLVIWSARLPHHGGPNRAPRPRVSQAISMFPAGTDEEREDRVACYLQKRAPTYWRGWKGQVDPEPGQPAALTSLGRRLVGIDRWP